MLQLDNLISRLYGVKRLPSGSYQALCPAHKDKNPSLRVTLLDDGKIVLKCWAGCANETIVKLLGLTFSDLFPEKIRINYSGKPPKVYKFPVREAFQLLINSSYILAEALQDALDGKIRTQEELESAAIAYKTVLEIAAEHGNNG